MAKLKVFRTATGFHDAYVAATSRKAALAAWGSDKDLFARGAAEEVTNPDRDLAAEALAAPGTVIRRLRGTAAEQLAALPPKPANTPRAAPAPPPEKARPKPRPRPRPRPSRDTLDAAEDAVARADKRRAAALADLAGREAALARERRTLEREGASESRRLARVRDEAAADYDRAMERWRERDG